MGCCSGSMSWGSAPPFSHSRHDARGPPSPRFRVRRPGLAEGNLPLDHMSSLLSLKAIAHWFFSARDHRNRGLGRERFDGASWWLVGSLRAPLELRTSCGTASGCTTSCFDFKPLLASHTEQTAVDLRLSGLLRLVSPPSLSETISVPSQCLRKRRRGGRSSLGVCISSASTA